MEDEKKEYDKSTKQSGHSGGSSMPRASKGTTRPVDIGEAEAPPEDQGMLEMFNRARGD